MRSVLCFRFIVPRSVACVSLQSVGPIPEVLGTEFVVVLTSEAWAGGQGGLVSNCVSAPATSFELWAMTRILGPSASGRNQLIRL